MLTVVLGICLLALVRVRSLLTAAVMLVALAATAALWWWRHDGLQSQVLVATGIVLIVGGWRHLGAAMASRTSGSDPGVLASLTHVPRVVWNATFVVVCAAATVLAALQLAVAWG